MPAQGSESQREQEPPRSEKSAEHSLELKRKKKKKKKAGLKYWPLKVFFVSLFLSLAFSLMSESIISGTQSLVLSILIVVFLIIVNILFDIIGMAFASSEIAPFISMSSRKIKGANMCIRLVKRAEIVANICADVIGDICGIICGAAGAGIVAVLLLKFSQAGDNLSMLLTILVSSLIAALTVSGKAAAKKFAKNNSQKIVFFCGRFLTVFAGERRDKQEKEKSAKNKSAKNAGGDKTKKTEQE